MIQQPCSRQWRRTPDFPVRVAGFGLPLPTRFPCRVREHPFGQYIGHRPQHTGRASSLRRVAAWRNL